LSNFPLKKFSGPSDKCSTSEKGDFMDIEGWLLHITGAFMLVLAYFLFVKA
jgi:hypothetical protein